MDMEFDMKRMEIDCVTGEVLEIELTPDEIKAYDKRIADDAKAVADAKAKVIADAQAKEAAEAKLTALGLTADDLKALGL
jgi:hypothetical protein